MSDLKDYNSLDPMDLVPTSDERSEYLKRLDNFDLTDKDNRVIMRDIYGQDVLEAIKECLLDVRHVACTDPNCPIVKSGQIHSHCPYCGAPFNIDFHSWHELINRPIGCRWCQHMFTYGPKFDRDYRNAADMVNRLNYLNQHHLHTHRRPVHPEKYAHHDFEDGVNNSGLDPISYGAAWGHFTRGDAVYDLNGNFLYMDHEHKFEPHGLKSDY